MKTFFCSDTQAFWPRCFALVDLVSAFASIEKMDFPHLQGKPVAVTNGDQVLNSYLKLMDINSKYMMDINNI